MTGSLIELVSDWLSMTTHSSGVFLLDPGLDVVYCVSREKGLEHAVNIVCDDWGGGGGFWGAVSCKDILSI
jgi:hypothetical protein